MIRTYKPNADLFFNKPYFLVKLVERINIYISNLEKKRGGGAHVYILQLTVVIHYFVAEINSLYGFPYITS